MVCPQIVDSGPAMVQLRDVRHPVLEACHPSQSFVPNTLTLGGPAPPVALLCGPNMGGKSTILRTCCVAVVMAQMGAYVKAQGATLSPFDRIFTRVGANDDLFRGRSTFFVEMEECATVLREATPRSLVVLDELGRGTSTFDGCAIADAVLRHLGQHIACPTLFVTHYHSLNEVVAAASWAQAFHMASCEEDGALVMLYQLVSGPSAKSFGTNVARLAGLPPAVVLKAQCKASDMEAEASCFATKLQHARALLGRSAHPSHGDGVRVLRALWHKLNAH